MKTLKHSRQRESIKNCLMARKDHPTADAIYTSIRQEYPNISLGTVYRNLKLLAELGEITRFSCGDGSEHFDYDTRPHYHFICRQCGAVTDLPKSMVRETSELLTVPVPGRVEAHTIFFYGLCAACVEPGGETNGEMDGETGDETGGETDSEADGETDSETDKEADEKTAQDENAAVSEQKKGSPAAAFTD